MKKMLVSAAAVILLAIGIANADDPPALPEMKEGLWSMQKHMVENPGNKRSDQTSTICRNHAYDRHSLSVAKGVKGCTTIGESFQGGKYSLQTHCLLAGTVVDSKGTTTFQGDTAAHAESHATYTPALAGISETTMIMDSKFEGSCPADMQPGDMKAADGKVIHLWKH